MCKLSELETAKRIINYKPKKFKTNIIVTKEAKQEIREIVSD